VRLHPKMESVSLPSQFASCGLIADSAGNFYGTTNGGGAAGAGVVFKIDKSGNESVLHTFTGGADGGSPYAGVTLGPEEQNQTTVKLRRWELAGAHSGEIRG
jgi:uncharacterized repeat protein (TIGR03803 family)